MTESQRKHPKSYKKNQTPNQTKQPNNNNNNKKTLEPPNPEKLNPKNPKQQNLSKTEELVTKCNLDSVLWHYPHSSYSDVFKT